MYSLHPHVVNNTASTDYAIRIRSECRRGTYSFQRRISETLRFLDAILVVLMCCRDKRQSLPSELSTASPTIHQDDQAVRLGHIPGDPVRLQDGPLRPATLDSQAALLN